jgi:hypothetical protein
MRVCCAGGVESRGLDRLDRRVGACPGQGRDDHPAGPQNVPPRRSSSSRPGDGCGCVAPAGRVAGSRQARPARCSVLEKGQDVPATGLWAAPLRGSSWSRPGDRCGCVAPAGRVAGSRQARPACGCVSGTGSRWSHGRPAGLPVRGSSLSRPGDGCGCVAPAGRVAGSRQARPAGGCAGGTGSRRSSGGRPAVVVLLGG